jgi:endonuclease YncB( thermonuclease family)
LGRNAGAALLGLLALVPLSASAADTVEGRVVAVEDGDTITVVDAAKVSHRIDLHGIDAPERAQAFGKESTANLSRLASGKPVRAECVKRERRPRRLCTVWTHPADCTECGFTLDLGLMQLLQGYAWHFSNPQAELPQETRSRYSAAQVEAKAKKAGLWADESPLAPWDWRRSAKAR